MSFPRQQHQYAYLLQKPVDASHLGTEALMACKHASGTEDLMCAYCREGLYLGGDENGWYFYHEGYDHQKETRAYYDARHRIMAHLQSLFPNAQIASPDRVGTWWVDSLLLTSRGGKLAVVLQSQPWSAKDVQKCLEDLEAEGITPLWLIMGEQLSAQALKRHHHHRVQYGEDATQLLKMNQPLWYWFDGMIVSAEVHPDVMQRIDSIKKIGWIESHLRRYPLSQLRMAQGMVAVMSTYDTPSRGWRKAPARFLK